VGSAIGGTVPLTQIETELRQRARELISSGRLPGLTPKNVWGGHGSGEQCALCGKSISRDEVEYEIEDRTQGNAAVLYRFHFLCHAAWQFECARSELLKRQGAP